MKKMIRILQTVLITGTAYVVNYGILLVLTPYITEAVGEEAYGFVSLAKQLAQYSVILTVALNTYASRYIGVACHDGDRKQANVYFSSVFYGDLFLVSTILVLSMLFIFFLEHLLVIPDYLIWDVKFLFFLILLNLWITTVFSVFGCVSAIKNLVHISGIFKTLSYLTNALVLYLTYTFFPAKLLYVGLGTIAAGLVVVGGDVLLKKKAMPWLRISPSNFSMHAISTLVVNGFWASLNNLGDVLNNGLDLIIADTMLSATAMAQVAVSKTIAQVVMSLYTIVDQAFFPIFLEYYAKKDKKALMNWMFVSMVCSGYVANLAFAGFFALGEGFFELWIPLMDVHTIYVLTVLALLTCIPTGAIHPLYNIYVLTVKKKIPCLVTIAGGVANVIGMLVLIQVFHFGVYSVAITTAAVMFVINFGTNPIYMAHVLHLPWTTFYPQLFRNTISCLLQTAVFTALARLFFTGSWFSLMLCGGIDALAGAVIHFLFATTRQQKRWVIHRFCPRPKAA